MLDGQTLLLAAVVTAALGVLATSVALTAGPSPRWRPRLVVVAWAGSWGAAVLSAAASLYLAGLLATADFSVRYVWQHTATYEPALRRMSALLAGAEGSFLLWALLASAVAAGTAHWWRSRRGEQRRDATLVHLTAATITLAVLLLTAASRPFETFAAAFPALGESGAPLEGRGLNPVLANPWMPPHTLLTFAAYALLGLGFALAMAQLLRTAQGRVDQAQRWRSAARAAARWSWVLLSAALLTGVVWAYEEMTFGWFWSWDPVESATLVIWLLLTAALHASGAGDGGRRVGVHAPLLLAGSFVAVVFASFVTRSGLHPSVHAFASGPVGGYLGAFLAVVAATTVVLGVAARRAVPVGRARRPWMSWAAALLLWGALLVAWGLSYPVLGTLLGAAVEVDSGFFTLWGYLFAVALLLLMGFGLQAARGSTRDAAVVLGVFVALTAVAAAVKPIAGLELLSVERRAAGGGLERLLGGASLLTLVPPAAYALLAIGECWWATLRHAPVGRRSAATGAAVAHAAAVVTIVGVTFATLLSSSVTVGVDPATGVGASEGIEVRVTQLEGSERLDGHGDVVEQRETATLEVRTGGRRLAAGDAVLSTYPERDMGRHARVLVDRGLLTDTQVIYHGTAEARPDGIPVTVRRIPLTNLVWGGLVLLVGGGVIASATGRRRGAVAPARERAVMARSAR